MKDCTKSNGIRLKKAKSNVEHIYNTTAPQAKKRLKIKNNLIQFSLSMKILFHVILKWYVCKQTISVSVKFKVPGPTSVRGIPGYFVTVYTRDEGPRVFLVRPLYFTIGLALNMLSMAVVVFELGIMFSVSNLF